MTIDPAELEPQRKGIPRVLIVDDEPDLRELLELTVLKMGFDVETAGTVAEARARLARQAFALCLTDMRLPDGDGIELVRLVGEQLPGTLIAVITAYGSTEAAVAALKAGAFDFLSKPVALDQLRITIQSALKAHDAAPARRNGAAVAAAAAPAGASGPAPHPERAVLGESPAMREVRATIARLALSMAPVAIYGESGTGKEVAARAIHAAGARADKPFVAVNCGAIPESLMEAEFFGYRKGAFTGAESDRDGFFQAANGGTLLLDEIAELPLAMQVKLLRAIQERRVRKVGATLEEPVDVRVISATHRNLAERVASGAFRQDLYYRLNVIELHMPPLRRRPEDIAVLSEAILRRLAQAEGRPAARTLSEAGLAALVAHPFPGNVRELENILERASAFAGGDLITAADLALNGAAPPVGAGTASGSSLVPLSAAPFAAASGPSSAPSSVPVAVAVPLAPASAASGATPADGAADAAAGVVPDVHAGLDALRFPCSLPDYLEAVERAIIERALEQTKFNRTAAARLLGVTFRQLRYRIQQLGIK